MLLQKQKQTTCRMIQSREISKKLPEMATADNYERITYEGYGPNGTAIIVKTLTDNKNRTASNVRNAFTKG